MKLPLPLFLVLLSFFAAVNARLHGAQHPHDAAEREQDPSHHRVLGGIDYSNWWLSDFKVPSESDPTDPDPAVLDPNAVDAGTLTLPNGDLQNLRDDVVEYESDPGVVDEPPTNTTANNETDTAATSYSSSSFDCNPSLGGGFIPYEYRNQTDFRADDSMCSNCTCSQKAYCCIYPFCECGSACLYNERFHVPGTCVP